MVLLISFPVVGVLSSATARLVPSLTSNESVTVYYRGGGPCCQFDMGHACQI